MRCDARSRRRRRAAASTPTRSPRWPTCTRWRACRRQGGHLGSKARSVVERPGGEEVEHGTVELVGLLDVEAVRATLEPAQPRAGDEAMQLLGGARRDQLV